MVKTVNENQHIYKFQTETGGQTYLEYPGNFPDVFRSAGRGGNLHEEDFGSRLLALRNKKGVSARDMSLSIGQNSGYINHIEKQHSLPSMPVFFNICHYLEITPEQFFAVEQKYPALVAEISEGLNDLSKEQLQSLAVIVQGLSTVGKNKKGIKKC